MKKDKLDYDPSKKKLSETQRKGINASNIKYQKNSAYYKEYRRNKWKKIIYDKMKTYIEQNTDDDIDDIIDEDDDIGEMRKQFKKKYGVKIYFRYISPQSELIYKKMATYIRNETDDTIRDIINKGDDPTTLRNKFKKKYGRITYYKYISKLK